MRLHARPHADREHEAAEPRVSGGKPCPSQSRRRGACLLLAVAVGVAGCEGGRPLNSQYGVRKAKDGQMSVNGTSVFAQMFQDAGFRVSTWHRLSPALDGRQEMGGPRDPKKAYRAIVWAPDDFDPPGPQHLVFLQSWLQSGGTLIYIGRDYDAAIEYWQSVLVRMPPDEVAEGVERLALAQSAHDAARATMDEEAVTPWFVVQRDGVPRTVNRLEGPWADELGHDSYSVRLHSRLVSPTEDQFQKYLKDVDKLLDEDIRGSTTLELPESEAVLSHQGEPVLLRLSKPNWRGGQVFVAPNGSFLLNLPLVNAQNRKIAERLVEACGRPGRVAFVVSDAGGPRVYATEPGGQNLRQRREPLSTILDHAVVLGVVACFVVLPIFGRAKVERTESISDFGKHVSAVGELLSKTNDSRYARELLANYQQLTSKEPKER